MCIKAKFNAHSLAERGWCPLKGGDVIELCGTSQFYRIDDDGKAVRHGRKGPWRLRLRTDLKYEVYFIGVPDAHRHKEWSQNPPSPTNNSPQSPPAAAMSKKRASAHVEALPSISEASDATSVSSPTKVEEIEDHLNQILDFKDYLEIHRSPTSQSCDPEYKMVMDFDELNLAIAKEMIWIQSHPESEQVFKTSSEFQAYMLTYRISNHWSEAGSCRRLFVRFSFVHDLHPKWFVVDSTTFVMYPHEC
jgi:hypothetical protein